LTEQPANGAAESLEGDGAAATGETAGSDAASAPVGEENAGDVAASTPGDAAAQKVGDTTEAPA